MTRLKFEDLAEKKSRVDLRLGSLLDNVVIKAQASSTCSLELIENRLKVLYAIPELDRDQKQKEEIVYLEKLKQKKTFVR